MLPHFLEYHTVLSPKYRKDYKGARMPYSYNTRVSFSFVERAADLGKQTCYRTNVRAKQASCMSHGPCSQVNICCKNFTATAVCKFAIKNMVLCFETDIDSSPSLCMHQIGLES